jgi:two-component system C4-dicarboxylate transport response regulator DctD
VRELRNIADRFVLGVPGSEDSVLQQSIQVAPLAEQVRNFERALIEVELRKHHGNVNPICEALGLPKQTLYHKMQKYQLVAEEYK